MANRSDFGSVFPRSLKRMWALTTGSMDAHRAGDIKRLMIAAHSAHKSAKLRVAKQGRSVEVSQDDTDSGSQS